MKDNFKEFCRVNIESAIYILNLLWEIVWSSRHRDLQYHIKWIAVREFSCSTPRNLRGAFCNNLEVGCEGRRVPAYHLQFSSTVLPLVDVVRMPLFENCQRTCSWETLQMVIAEHCGYVGPLPDQTSRGARFADPALCCCHVSQQDTCVLPRLQRFVALSK